MQAFLIQEITERFGLGIDSIGLRSLRAERDVLVT